MLVLIEVYGREELDFMVSGNFSRKYEKRFGNIWY